MQTTAETAKDHNGAIVTSGSLNNKVGWERERGKSIIRIVVLGHKRIKIGRLVVKAWQEWLYFLYVRANSGIYDLMIG